MTLVSKTYHKNAGSSSLMEVTKLSVALDLYLDGYDEITFNRWFGEGGEQVCVHVFAEDSGGSKVAVYCVSRAEMAKRDKLASVVHRIMECIGDDCQIAVAIPLRLMSVVHEVKDTVYRIYMVDECGRVWIHDPSRHFSVNRSRVEMEGAFKTGEHRPAKVQGLILDNGIKHVV
jgi:hypothetical protein